jgi:UDP-N-acetyl-D-glucosamine dehydrogenase
VDDLDKAVATADLVVLVQAHAAYDVESLAESAVRFFDTRGATTSSQAIRL